MEDRKAEARRVMAELGIGDEWEAVVDADMPPHLAELARDVIDAYRRADLEWLLDHADPDVEIVQLRELPDARSYEGRDGLVDALLDWPRQWEDLRMEPRRILAAGDDHLLIDAVHHGRPRSMEIEVAAEIVFLMRWVNRRMTNWDMFLTLDEALRRAAERSAHSHDDHAAQGHRRE